MKCPECMRYELDKDPYSSVYFCPNCGLRPGAMIGDIKNMELNGMSDKQIGLVVSLPQGTEREANFGDSLGRLLPKRGKNGQAVKTKNGEPVYQLALDLTNLRTMIEKHKLKSKDKRSGHDIVWVTGFVSDIRTGKTAPPAAGF